MQEWANLSRLQRFWHENGLYVLGASLVELPVGLMRNALLARKFGVKRIKIGPRSYLRGLCCVRMGEDLATGEGLWLDAILRYNDQTFSPKIIVGNHVRISHYVHITATHLVEIGDDVLIGSKVMITDHNHGHYSQLHSSPDMAPTLRPLSNDRSVVIGRNVWLADGVVVTAGSSIGEGSVISANSVVQGSIPPFSIAGGIPATVRKRFDFATQKWCSAE